MTAAIEAWTFATARLTASQQRVIQDTLLLAQSGDIKIVYGCDEFDGRPCLINAIGNMLKEVSDNPISMFWETVITFDGVCRDVRQPFEPEYYVTPLMAEVLVRHFGKLKPLPEFLTELPEIDIVVPDYYDAG